MTLALVMLKGVAIGIAAAVALGLPIAALALISIRRFNRARDR
jgi:hypothetical protein